jgi:hypothetical protein
MSRKRVIVGIVVLTIAIAALMTVLMWPRSGGETNNNVVASTQQQTSRSQSEPLPFTDANARMLEVALNSKEKAEQVKALIPQLRQGDWQSSAVLPQGATLTIDQTSFTRDGDDYGSVNATASGSVQATFILHLVPVNDQWLISSTEHK